MQLGKVWSVVCMAVVQSPSSTLMAGVEKVEEYVAGMDCAHPYSLVFLHVHSNEEDDNASIA